MSSCSWAASRSLLQLDWYQTECWYNSYTGLATLRHDYVICRVLSNARSLAESMRPVTSDEYHRRMLYGLHRCAISRARVSRSPVVSKVLYGDRGERSVKFSYSYLPLFRPTTLSERDLFGAIQRFNRLHREVGSPKDEGWWWHSTPSAVEPLKAHLASSARRPPRRRVCFSTQLPEAGRFDRYQGRRSCPDMVRYCVFHARAVHQAATKHWKIVNRFRLHQIR